jgi:predicted permease
MRLVSRLWSLWRNVVHHERLERELDEEIRSMHELLSDEQLAAGLPDAAARRIATLELGGVEQVKEHVRERRAGAAIESVFLDIAYAYLTLRRSPGFAMTAILTLALGIGSATLIFSIIYSIFLKPLPIAEPDRVVAVARVTSSGIGVTSSHSFPDYRDLERRNTTFAGLAAFFQVSMTLETGRDIVRETPVVVTGNYFEVLGAQPLLGRLLTPEDDRDGADATIVLSYDFWTTAYHADPAVLGTTIRVLASRALSANGVSEEKTYTVVGVAPKEFYGTDVSIRPPAWIPVHAFLPEARLAARQPPGPACTILGRLKDRVSREAAQSNLMTIANDLAREYPATDAGYRVLVTDVESRLNTPQIRAFASGVLLLAGLVLLAATASVATALTARTIDRHREIGIRISLGAGRLRVIRMVLVEALVIAGVSGAIAYGMAWWTTHLLSQLSIPVLGLPVQVDVHPDARVFLVAVIVSMLASVGATIAPGRLIVALDPNHTLKGLQGPLSGRRWAARDLLTVAQVIFSCVLMAACLVSIVGMRRALFVPIGFDAKRVAAVTLDFDVAKYTPEQQSLFMQRAADEVRRLPAVVNVAYARELPLTGAFTLRFVVPEGRTPAVQPSPLAVLYSVTPDYFRTMGIRRLAGRDLDVRDTSKALVNEAFVRQVLGSAPAIGTHVTFGNGGNSAASGPKVSLEIVGVVAGGKYVSLAESSQPAIFTPFSDAPFGRPTMVVRTSGSAASIAPTVGRTIATMDPRLPVLNVGSLDQLIAPSLLPNQAAAIVLTAFGVLGLLLAMTSIHGVVSYTISRRRWEIGLRVALGASRVRVIGLVLGRVAVISATGIALGVLGTVGLTGVLGHIVYLASSAEPIVLGGVTAMMLLAVAIALTGPIARSLRIEPAVALKSQ